MSKVITVQAAVAAAKADEDIHSVTSSPPPPPAASSSSSSSNAVTQMTATTANNNKQESSSDNSNNNHQKKYPVNYEDVLLARDRIRKFVRVTPLFSKSSLADLSGYSRVFFKAENLNVTGSFKIRGSFNAVLAATEERKRKGLQGPVVAVSHSSGNHAAALSKACRMTNNICHVVVPHTSPEPKVRAIRRNGAHLTFCEPTPESREDACKKIVRSIDGAEYISSSAHPNIIAGQGTAALEILEQFREMHGGGYPDVVVAPVSGGGLLAGTALVVKKLSPRTLVVGAEPAKADDAARSLRSGRLELNDSGPIKTIADGLLTNLSPLTFSIIKDNVDDIITVTEQEIGRSMRLIHERLKLVVEPSAAVSAAVGLFHRAKLIQRYQDRSLKTCCIILSGGNVDIEKVSFYSKL